MYRPGRTILHQLDPRTKLLGQIGFAAAAFAHTNPRALAVLTVITGLVVFAARVSPRGVLRSNRFVFPFLLAAPLIGAFTFGSPWIRLSDAVDPLLSSYRVLLVLVVSGVYLRTTAVRESQAAVARLVPGRVGRVLSLGVGLVCRFLPVLRRDLFAIRDAMTARLGDQQPIRERMRPVATTGLTRAFQRGDRLALALQTRCLSWNPTLPALQFRRIDAIPLVVSGALLLAGVLPVLPGY
ncbi:energy-coupling factor transporter transmembrane protein EcfT [Halobacteria archaeon AArc-dxtr1]|nr:energy-coupling factor transporter transmembrane protein EcfT [Halobacteria archaeon AArc-dxtr1]